MMIEREIDDDNCRVRFPAGRDNRGVTVWSNDTLAVSKTMAWGNVVILPNGGEAYPDETDYEWRVKTVGVLRPNILCSKCYDVNPEAMTIGDLSVCVYCIRDDLLSSASDTHARYQREGTCRHCEGRVCPDTGGCACGNVDDYMEQLITKVVA